MKTFTAKCVTCQNENGVVIGGFADGEMEQLGQLFYRMEKSA